MKSLRLDLRRLHRFLWVSSSLLSARCCFNVWTVTATSSSATATSSYELPPALRARVQRRHDDAIAAARRHYSVDDLSDDDDDDDDDSSFDVDDLSFDSFSVADPSVVPDFGGGDDDDDDALFPNPCVHVCRSSPRPLLDARECDDLIAAANAHFGGPDDWTTLMSGDRHPVKGFWIRDVPAVHAVFRRRLRDRLFPTLRRLFPEFCGAEHNETIESLVCDSAYLFRYAPDTGRRTDVHTDSGCLSFTIALNGRDEYEGGGTWLDDGRDDGAGRVVHIDKGCAVFRPGGLRHRGEAVTRGVRYVVGGFVAHERRVEEVRSLVGLALDALAAGDLDDAIASSRAAVRRNPRFDGARVVAGRALARAGRDDEAVGTLEATNHRRNAEAAYSLGAARRRRGDPVGAAAAFEACLAVEPDDAEAALARAAVAVDADDRAGARRWFARTIETPGARDATRATAHAQLGVLAGEDGDRAAEDARYAAALAIDPAHHPALRSRAAARAQDGRWTEATADYRSAVDAAPHAASREETLRELYRATCELVNNDPAVVSGGRDAAMRALTNCMGQSNFDELMGILQKERQRQQQQEQQQQQ